MPELSWNINLLKREENNYFTKKKKKSHLFIDPEARLASFWNTGINVF